VNVAGTRALVEPPPDDGAGPGAAPPVGRVWVWFDPVALAVRLLEEAACVRDEAVAELVELVAAVAEEVLLEPELPDPPHPARSRRTGNRTKKGRWRLTL
jgi:hypothetical protein